MISAAELIDIARSYVGVRYVHQGRSRRGVDCLGLILAVCNDCKLLPPDFKPAANYGQIQQGELRKAVEVHCGPPTGLQLCGALALISWPGHRHAGHIAFVTGPNMIHAYSRSEKVVEHGLRPPWTRLIYGFYKIPGVDYE
jgi:cell wall-associated NlpC family hydrolase